MRNAKQECDYLERRTAYLEREAKIVLVHHDDPAAFQIFSDAADATRELAEWQRNKAT